MKPQLFPQDALLHSPVLLQLHATGGSNTRTLHLAFPLDQVLACHGSNVFTTWFQERASETEGVAECVAALGSSVDIESSCGYLTLVTVPKEDKKGKGEVKGDGGKDCNASDSRKEDRESSPDGAELNSSNAQLLEEELDNIDCPMAGSLTSSMTKSSILPLRPTDLQLGVKVEPLEENCSWQLLDVTFGIPLFDMELNAAVTKRQDSKSEFVLAYFIISG